jgi:tyrosinase
MTSITSAPLELPEAEELDEITRADLVFYGVDHSGPSYEARVYLNNPDADPDTPREPDHGYAGYFTVFGHDGCYGDEGHCLLGQRTSDVFDVRAPHPLRPFTKTVIATEAVLRAIKDAAVTEVSVTVVAVLPEDDGTGSGSQPVRYEYVRLLTYEG